MPHSEQPSYEELAARHAELKGQVFELLAVVAEQASLIAALRTEVAAPRPACVPGFHELIAAPEPGRPGGWGEGR